MPLRYDPPQFGALRQGEILGEVYEHIPRLPAIKPQEGQEPLIESVHHKILIVMSPDCDLDFDFKARFLEQNGKDQPISLRDFLESPKTLFHILLAKIVRDINPTLPSTILRVFLARIFDKAHIKLRFLNTQLWKQVEKNQNERYHYLPEAPVGNPPITTLPGLYIDFKKSLSIPTQHIYEGLRDGGIQRIALIPDKFIHDLIHRFYGFLSRVAV